jgi:hypothetical protein
MKRAIRLFGITLVFAAGLVVLGDAPGAWACSCIGYTDEQEARAAYFQDADLVFSGVAKSMYDANAGNPVRSSGDPIEWTFDTDSSQKGEAADPQKVSSAREGATCGFRFTIGKRYQVFAGKQGSTYATNTCGGTHALAAGERPWEDRLPPTGVGPPRPVAAAIIASACVLIVALRLRPRKI